MKVENNMVKDEEYIENISSFRYHNDRRGIEYYFFPNGATAHSGPGLPHCGGFTITDTHTHSVGLLWTRDQPEAETYT
jgi:hypothetical protein